MSTENLVSSDGDKSNFLIEQSKRLQFRRRYGIEPSVKPWIVILTLGVGIGLFIAGALIVGFGLASDTSSTCRLDDESSASEGAYRADVDIVARHIKDRIDPDRIRQNLIDFTSTLHLAGTTANQDVADDIVKKWQTAGLEDVHTVEYNVLLSYPDFSNPNYLWIKDTNGKVVYKSEGVSPSIAPEKQNLENAGLQWLAYAPNGSVTADVVYCGRATEKDFQYLKENGISLKGKIALIRYGESFRGNKVALAQQNGAVGAILYSDPAEVAPDGTGDKNVYPKTAYMPPHGVQRGTLHAGDGDPLTPLYAAKANLWRSGSVEEARANGDLPSIPALPISYTSAMALLSKLKGPTAPKDWQGGLNVTYKLGPGLENNLKTTITINGYFEVKRIRNVIGYIHGAEEPDRYVILGNHYDAWTFGAMDPNSGTAALAEVARATVQVMRESLWRPRRTLMFAAWDAEEYGLIGSTEFVEEFAELLSRRAVAYLNMDCMQGNQTIYVEASPSLQDQAVLVAKNIQNPRKDEKDVKGTTVFDAWLHYMKDTDEPSLPRIPVPSAASDQKSFLNYLGIPSVSFAWVDMDKHLTYPLYHTFYETPFAVEHLMDVDHFSILKATSQYWIEMAVRLAETETIPYSLHTLAMKLKSKYIPDLEKAIASLKTPTYVKDALVQLDHMKATCERFEVATRNEEAIQLSRGSNSITYSQYNDRLINVERCFVNPRGAPGDASARHVLFSISKTNQYAGAVMQQVHRVINDMAQTKDSRQLEALSDELANQISIVHNSVLCAVGVLADFI